MTITAAEITAFVERELGKVRDRRVLHHIRGLLVEPTVVMRDWDYGAEHEAYACWAVLNHIESNTGIAYCESGFGPRSPWGLVFLSGTNTSIGMDSGWFGSFLDAYFDSMAVTELSIWRAFKQEGDGYPGTPLTEESDWDSTWDEVYRLRESDSIGRYHCSHSICIQPNET